MNSKLEDIFADILGYTTIGAIIAFFFYIIYLYIKI